MSAVTTYRFGLFLGEEPLELQMASFSDLADGDKSLSIPQARLMNCSETTAPLTQRCVVGSTESGIG